MSLREYRKLFSKRQDGPGETKVLASVNKGNNNTTHRWLAKRGGIIRVKSLWTQDNSQDDRTGKATQRVSHLKNPKGRYWIAKKGLWINITEYLLLKPTDSTDGKVMAMRPRAMKLWSPCDPVSFTDSKYSLKISIISSFSIMCFWSLDSPLKKVRKSIFSLWIMKS